MEPDIAFDFESATTADVVQVSSSGAHLGGVAQELGDKEDVDIVLEPFLPAGPRTPSIQTLMTEMKESIQDYILVQDKLGMEEWNSFFRSLSPEDYGKIIKQVDLDFDQPKVASAIANEHPNFTCDHVVAAIANCSDWNTASLVERLLPYTKDLATNKDKILCRLSDWDRTVTERAFRNALEGKS